MGTAVKACAAALLLALAWPAAGQAAAKNLASGKAAAPAGDVIAWVLPWREGMELRYATSDDEVGENAAGRSHTRTRGTETVRIVEAGKDGFLQRWTFSGGRHEVLEGDAAGAEIMQGMIDSLADLTLDVELDAGGSYAGIRNLAAIRERMRPAMRTAMAAGFEAAAVADADADADPAAQALARAAALEQVDAIVERFLAPDVLEALLSEDAIQYNDFVGVELEDGRHHEVDIELDNPLAGGTLPARVGFAAYVREAEPDDVFLEWTSRLDPEKAAEAAAVFAGKLYEEGMTEAIRKGVPELSIIDEGVVLFRRSTGVVELLEATRTVRAAGELKVERRRMRLLDGDHDHGWADDGPPQPATEPGAG